MVDDKGSFSQKPFSVRLTTYDLWFMAHGTLHTVQSNLTAKVKIAGNDLFSTVRVSFIL
jgi:hypothetical protein